MNSADALQRLLRGTGIHAQAPHAQKLQKYLALLEKWNARINLTAKTDWKSLQPLFFEGIWAAAQYPAAAGAHLDIGSGAGFPALILRILVPGMQLEMVESRGKKGAFLETVAYELDLAGTRVHTQRLTAVLAAAPAAKTWDCISWKAIKLGRQDLLQLLAHAHAHTQFWMFHGQEAAVEDPPVLESHFKCIAQLPLPGQRDSHLSIYRPREPQTPA